MFCKLQTRLSLVLCAALLFTGPAALAQRGGRGSSGQSFSGQGGGGRNFSSGQSRGFAGQGRGYAVRNRGSFNRGGRSYYSGNRYSAPYRGYGGGFSAGRFYTGRGYFYGGRFWARPFFGIGIPFGYGYYTNRGCGYVDNWGDFYRAPCY